MKKKTAAVILSVLLLSIPSVSSAAISFPDTPSTYWAYNEIQFLTGKKIINGYKDGTFRPSVSISRIQAASMMVKALGLSTTGRPDPGFKDIHPGDDGYEIAATVADEGIFSGNKGNFNAHGTLTRAQMAKILSESKGLSYVYPVHFKDVQEGNWAFEYVNALYSNGITTGYSDLSYRPGVAVSRAQFAVFMARMLNPAFVPGIVFDEEKAEVVWGTDDSLTLHIPISNHTNSTLSAINGSLSVATDEGVIAEANFNFDSITLKPGETKIVTLKFAAETVYDVVDIGTFKLFHNLSFSEK
ncbi:S-layer homology domain-containing protein [Falsibacillus pallidus]|uniref:S-layer family protein n=1 Tax=Falsibacillus pallidus TaxID=493781 RepID=A0A370FZT3_9BACI|nr:S-layer homology domain-containing protein [Falsibacillus pallidus]RDI36480.1 S-layer family protein [Falsibacillus pallidus]